LRYGHREVELIPLHSEYRRAAPGSSGDPAAAEGAAVAIPRDDEPATNLIPATTYEWLLEQIGDAEVVETMWGRQAQLHQAVDVEPNQL